MPKVEGVEKINILKISQVSHEKVKHEGNTTITRKTNTKN